MGNCSNLTENTLTVNNQVTLHQYGFSVLLLIFQVYVTDDSRFAWIYIYSKLIVFGFLLSCFAPGVAFGDGEHHAVLE